MRAEARNGQVKVVMYAKDGSYEGHEVLSLTEARRFRAQLDEAIDAADPQSPRVLAALVVQ